LASNFWGDTQRLAQSAFADVSNTYQQFLTGTTDPSRRNLNYEIAADAYEPTAEDWKEYGLYLDEQERNNPDAPQEPDIQEPDIEP
jgi:hypothetical protein